MPTTSNAVPFVAFSYGPVSPSLRTGVNDSNYTVTAADTIIALTNLSASRTVSLPSPSSLPLGKDYIIKDESGLCSSGRTITVIGTIDGANNLVLSSAYASARLYTNGLELAAGRRIKMAFTDPIATSATPFTVRSSAHPLAPSSYFTWSNSKLRPTNAWWQNLIIPHYDSGNYNGKTATFPYAQWPQANGKGFTVSYFGDQPGDRDVQANAITLSGAKDISLGINETLTSREIIDYTDLGVSLRFNHSGGSMTSHFVQGMAFNSGIFSQATPVITIEGAILEINGVSPGSAVLTGVTKLTIKTNRYDRVWVVYASSALNFTLSGSTLTATAAYTGRIQMAVLGQASDEAVYDSASTALLTGGSVTASYSGASATLSFSFTSVGTGAPLVFALPHHQDMLGAVTYSGVQLSSLRGPMKALRTSSWTLSETLPTLSWTTTNPIPASAYSDIQTALDSEKNSTHDIVGNGWGISPYYYGKYLAKMAQLVLIAEQIGDTAAATQIASSIKSQISAYLSASPTGSAGQMGSGYKNVLLYQGGSTWRGISTENGLADMGADFGSGRFNDHHFHYGYWIFAAAVVARNDASWRTTNQAAIEALIRDIANPSETDTYFPKFRHKDWYAGHSWAGGLVGIDVGPGQESTSEAINAWYGVYLWGVATSNASIRDLGRLLLATEVRSAKKYWHITDTTIYPSPFNTHGTAVIVRSHKVAVETYFGSRAEYFYGIQSLPFTPATELYMDAVWVTKSYPLASVNLPISPTGNPQDTGWNSVIYGMHAVIDPTAGYNEVKALSLAQIPEYDTSVQYGRDFDNGHTKANALYWAATRSASSGPATTTTSLSASPSVSATSGVTVTLTATVAPSSATGTVTFLDGSTSLSTSQVTAGIATFSITTLSVGNHSLSAQFTASSSLAYSNSASSALSYTITASGGGGSTVSSVNAVPFIALSQGAPATSVRTTVTASSYTVVPQDTIIACLSPAIARTITLPAASSVQVGKQFIIKDEVGTCSPSAAITIIGTIDGAASLTLNSAYAQVVLYSNGASWFSV